MPLTELSASPATSTLLNNRRVQHTVRHIVTLKTENEIPEKKWKKLVIYNVNDYGEETKHSSHLPSLWSVDV